MLDNDNARTVGRQGFKEYAQGLGAAGGGPHHDHLFGGLDHGLGNGFVNHDISGQFGGNDPRPGGNSGQLGLARRLHRITDAHPGLFQKDLGAHPRFLDDLNRPVLHGPHGGFRARLGETGTHDHRNGMLAHDFLQKGDAVHARHLHIQGDDIRDLGLDPVGCDKGISSRGHHLDGRIRGKNFAQCLADNGGIIDNKYSDFLFVHRISSD